MDLDRALVSAILREGKTAMQKAVEKGVRDEFLATESQHAFLFINEFISKYDAFPTPAEIQGKLGYSIIDTTAPAEFYADEVLNRRLHGGISDGLKEVVSFLEKRDPKNAYLTYETNLRALRKEQHVVQKSVNLLTLAPDFLAYYDKLKAGITGVLTPWRTINEATLGFWPEDFVLIVARLGIGKTWFLTLLAEHAWHVQKKRVLFASTEMSKERILQRFYALHMRLPYEEFRKAKLGVFVEQKFREQAAALQAMDGMYIVGGDFDFRVESLEAAIDDCEPDLVLLDGAYLLKGEGDGRTEKAANSFDDIKRLAKRCRVPLVATTQFNRQAKVNSAASASVDKIALSDAAGWNADLIFGLVQTEDMKRDGRMILKPMKFREGIGEDVECLWDFANMDFREVGEMAPPQLKPRSSHVDDDPYSTGLDFGSDDGDSGVPF